MCMKQLLALLSAIISILSWALLYVSYISHSLLNVYLLHCKQILIYSLDYLSYLTAVFFCHLLGFHLVTLQLGSEWTLSKET